MPGTTVVAPMAGRGAKRYNVPDGGDTNHTIPPYVAEGGQWSWHVDALTTALSLAHSPVAPPIGHPRVGLQTGWGFLPEGIHFLVLATFGIGGKKEL